MEASFVLSSIPGFRSLLLEEDDQKAVTNVLKLNKTVCHTMSDAAYKVITYDKEFLTQDAYETYGLCRSVIVNSTNRVVCFAPPKSLPGETFMTKYPEGTEGVVAEEFVEGTMMNVFWDDTLGVTGSWEIATRNVVGAQTVFYKDVGKGKNFRKMFLEAASECCLILENLDRRFCYSFVLQHPENRIVVPFAKPTLYLVGLYSLAQDDAFNVVVHVYDVAVAAKQLLESTSLKVAAKYPYTTYAELIEKYASMNTSYNIMGFVLHNRQTGERTKVRNPVYETVRHLKGNQPKMQYQYLCLRQDGKVGDFLKFYPEKKKDFSKFRDQVHLFTTTLYENYARCYIKKEAALMTFPKQYRHHMYNLHQKYLTEMVGKVPKEYINKMVCVEYVNAMHPSVLMYALNYEMRKRNIDVVRAESS